MICDFCGETVLFEIVCPHCVKAKTRVKEAIDKCTKNFPNTNYDFDHIIPEELLKELGLQ